MKQSQGAQGAYEGTHWLCDSSGNLRPSSSKTQHSPSRTPKMQAEVQRKFAGQP